MDDEDENEDESDGRESVDLVRTTFRPTTRQSRRVCVACADEKKRVQN